MPTLLEIYGCGMADLELQAMWSTDSISNPRFVEYISEVNYGSLNVPANINVCALL